MNDFEVEVYKRRNPDRNIIKLIKKEVKEEQDVNYIVYAYNNKVLCVKVMHENKEEAYEDKEAVLNAKIDNMNSLIDMAFGKDKRGSTAALIDLTSTNVRNLNESQVISQIENKKIGEVVQRVYTSVVRDAKKSEEVYDAIMTELGVQNI